MWFAKISIIFFIFCVVLLFFGYYINTIIGDPCLAGSANSSNLNNITSTYQAEANSTNFNQNLVFGDFLSTWTLLKNIILGITFQQATNVLSCSNWGGFDSSLQILLVIMFSLSAVFLLIYIISFRSV